MKISLAFIKNGQTGLCHMAKGTYYCTFPVLVFNHRIQVSNWLNGSHGTHRFPKGHEAAMLTLTRSAHYLDSFSHLDDAPVWGTAVGAVRTGRTTLGGVVNHVYTLRHHAVGDSAHRMTVVTVAEGAGIRVEPLTLRVPLAVPCASGWSRLG